MRINKEYKISLAILIFGLIGVSLMVYFKKSKIRVHHDKEVTQKEKEQIILPQISKENENRYENIKIIKEYLDDIQHSINSGLGVVPLGDSELDYGAKIAQEILLKDKKFLADIKVNGKTTHNDMMRITPANISDLNPSEAQICKKHRCYKAQKYNFYTNATTQAIVDIDDKRVLSIERFSNFQPDISLRLKRVAEAIVLNSPEIAKELGHTPKRYEMSMANVRTAFQGSSPCEDSSHLCVAPTFANHQKERALWAIVDLTQLELVVAKWAGLGKTTTPSCISQRILENKYIMENFCKKNSRLKRDGWEIKYRLTTSDGLEVLDVKFKDKYVIKSAKIVDWHVAYRGEGTKDINTSESVCKR
jgi:Cu2+-containing amine oxidase